MAEYIDKEKALSTLENTAKYYEMPNADEWTKGIHYGLIHGVDNIVDNVPIEDVVEREKIDAAVKNIKNIDLIVHDGINHYYKSGEEVKAEVLVILKLLLEET